jgi:hypothetical protein
MSRCEGCQLRLSGAWFVDELGRRYEVGPREWDTLWSCGTRREKILTSREIRSCFSPMQRRMNRRPAEGRCSLVGGSACAQIRDLEDHLSTTKRGEGREYGGMALGTTQHHDVSVVYSIIRWFRWEPMHDRRLPASRRDTSSLPRLSWEHLLRVE